MKNKEKIVFRDIPQNIADEMEKIGFGAGTKELLKDAHGNLKTKEQILRSTENFYKESGMYVEVKIIDNPEDPESAFVFIKNR